MKLDGILDADAVCHLWAKKDQLFQEREIDLADVKHITSAGIALLVKWAKNGAENSTSKLRLLHVSKEAKQALMLFGVSSLFELAE